MSIDTNDKKLAVIELDQVYEPAIPFHDPQLSSVPTRRQLLWGYPHPNAVRFSISSAMPMFLASYTIVSHSDAFGSPASQHPYFDFLCAEPEAIFCRSYRTQAEIELDAEEGETAFPDVAYDDVEDAARVTFIENATNANVQIRPTFGEITTGKLLFTWDVQWEGGWEAKKGELNVHDAFQLAYNGTGDQRRVSIHTHYEPSKDPEVGFVDTRFHFWEAAGANPLVPEPDADFYPHVARWTRYWAEVNFTASTYTLWVADRNRTPVKVNDAVSITIADNGVDPSLGLDGFWFEFSSKEARIGPEMYLWFRNLVVLHNADADALVAAGHDIPGL